MFVAITIFLKNSQFTQHLGYSLGKFLSSGTVILLSGNLGAGKTTLVQGIAKGLNISESIVSPTFTLINEYTDGRIPLYHLDLYRLKPSEVDSIYPEMYWEGIEVAPGITAIEWQEHLQYRPPNYLQLDLSIEKASNRTALINLVGDHNFSSNDLKLHLERAEFECL